MARTGRPITKLELSDDERTELRDRLAVRKAPADEKLRIRIVLSCADGESGKRIADRLKTSTQTVSKWRRRYQIYRFSGLTDAPRTGRPRTVSFEDVSFGYRPGLPILRHLSLDIAAGQTIGVVGQTGSGNTTLVKLLLRFYETSNGRISLDGHDVSALESRDLRGAVGLVSQDVFLFDGTIRENIAYGSRHVPMKDVERAAGLAEATEFIERLPAGFDTEVGERDIKLSGGQRQRLSLARAILKDPPILVLDEATAALDNETEAAIQKSLAKISKGRTTIVIAHRLSTIRHADRIIVLGNGGTLLESDTHEGLLRLNGAYASLWRVQTGEAPE